MNIDTIDKQTVAAPIRRADKRRLPPDLNIFIILVGIALLFELIGWVLIGQSFLLNLQRLKIMILQVSVIGIIAVGATQVLITAGVDLSAGSMVGMTAILSASLAQTSQFVDRAVYPSLVDLPFIVPVLLGVGAGLLAGIINGTLVAKTKIPPFIATLGMFVSARGVAKWYTKGQPVSFLSDGFTFFGSGLVPVVIFLVVALIFHIALRYTRYGKFTYAIGSNIQAARVSGINIEAHLIKVYAIAGLLAGLAGVVTTARAQTAQAGMGIGYEFDAITAAVIGGTSLAGGVGRITGTVIGTLILGVMLSGFTFLRIDAYYQEIIKGIIIVGAVVTDVYRQNKKKKV